ncbi:MAG: hypothetical protein Q8O72_12355 [Bacteroidales bacterium]|nr:hypothetical protein [Bacteroidales bacterium]
MMKEQSYQQMIIFVVVYFFFNSFLLPEGLLFTTILTPVMVYFLFKEREIKKIYVWSLALLIPIPFHVLQGVVVNSYLISSVMVFTALIFLICVYYVVKKYTDILDSLFHKVLLINALFVFIALIALPIPGISDLFWYDVPLTKGMEVVLRLKLFTYEPSYYSLVMMPVFLYFLMRVFYNTEEHPLLIFLASVIPMFLSLSFGVIGAFLLAFLISVLVFWAKIPKTLKRFSILSTLFMVFVLGLIFILWPQNPIYFRIENIFHGQDTSAMGRLVYSFMFARDIIVQHNIFFGIGPGQIKIIAHDMIINHYKYHGTLGDVVRIPNAMAEILSIYGIYGFVFKLFLEVFFFVKKRIYNNHYALILFLFIFIYQFTGSFINNVAELGIWALVFGARFIEFDFPKSQTSE